MRIAIELIIIVINVCTIAASQNRSAIIKRLSIHYAMKYIHNVSHNSLTYLMVGAANIEIIRLYFMF